MNFVLQLANICGTLRKGAACEHRQTTQSKAKKILRISKKMKKKNRINQLGGDTETQ